MTWWLVFFGTNTYVVRAASERKAFTEFLRLAYPTAIPGYGHLARPHRDEVTIRRPREGDRGWIEDAGDPVFMAALKEATS